MSIKKLESMLKKLEESDKQVKAKAKGGFVGIGHVAKSSLKKSGGVLSGGVKCGGVRTTGGVKCTCVCPRCGGRLTGGRLTGGVDNFAGVEGGRLTGGVDNFAGVEGGRRRKLPMKTTGGVLLGGVDNFAGVEGGRMRSDYRSYNTSTSQRGNRKLSKQATEPYGYNEIDTGVAGGKKRKSSGPSHLNNWRQFLTAYRAKHPGMSLKEAMQGASVEYRK